MGTEFPQAGTEKYRCTLDEEEHQTVYSYKNHTNVDRNTKLISAWEMTSAQVHDSQILEGVL